MENRQKTAVSSTNGNLSSSSSRQPTVFFRRTNRNDIFPDRHRHASHFHIATPPESEKTRRNRRASKKLSAFFDQTDLRVHLAASTFLQPPYGNETRVREGEKERPRRKPKAPTRSNGLINSKNQRGEMTPVGQTSEHAPQSMQVSESIE